MIKFGGETEKSGLTENVVNDFAVRRSSKVAALVAISQLLVINSEQMKNSCLQVMHMNEVLTACSRCSHQFSHN